jgi:hypothetical protein
VVVGIITNEQACELWGVTPRPESELCRNERIEVLGAYRIGISWVFPANTHKPEDERIKSGKYVGYKRNKMMKNK